ncbi:MAG TPA: hypothetical protein VH558_04205 [Pseudolabrys sp.]
MKNPFSRKSPQERRDAVAAQLAEAEQQAKAAQDERLKLALAGEPTEAAEEKSWKLTARVGTLRDALAALDQEVAAAEAAAAKAKIEADRKRAIAKLDDLADRLDAEISAYTAWVQGKFRALMQEVDQANGTTFSQQLVSSGPWFAVTDILRRESGTVRGLAKSIPAGVADDRLSRILT